MPTISDWIAADAEGGILPPEALSAPRVRAQLSPSAVRLFLRIASQWGLTVSQRRSLLGEISRSTYQNWRKDRCGVLSPDQLERISLLLGVHKALKLLFVDWDGAMRWFRSPNRDIAFAGHSPLDRLLLGGLDDLHAVRRYLDAWRGVK